MSGAAEERIVFFDGHCGLCSKFVDFVIARDPARKLRYAPLQGATAKKILSQQEFPDSVVYYELGHTYLKSSAALRILLQLSGFWYLFGIFIIVPGFVRDAIYDWVAANRYAWFGKSDHCRLPTEEEREYFLD